MPEPVTLPPTDSLYLNLDTPENLMIIESIMWFDEPLDFDAVIETLRARLLDRYPVFRWRAEQADSVRGVDRWVEDTTFALENHVTLHRLDGDPHTGVQEFLEAIMSEPLPRDRPLWHAHVLNGDNASAMVTRFHHAVADGTALVRVLLDLTSESPDTDTGRAPTPRAGPTPRSSRANSSAAGVDGGERPPPAAHYRERPQRRTGAGRTFTSMISLPVAAGVTATNSASALLTKLDPGGYGTWLRTIAAQARGTAEAADKLLVGTPPDVLPFGRPGLAKRADWTQPYELADVKRIARAQGATVNDVMLGALAGALRRYVTDRGETPRDVMTMIPVNMRPADVPLPEHPGNRFALVALELPVSQLTATARIATAKARMDIVKAGPEAMLTFGIAHALGSVGAVAGPASQQVSSYFGNKAFGVTTNVPGPTEPRFFAGAELVGILGWVPGASQQTLGASIFSYNGVIRVGFKVDAGVIPEPGDLITALDAEMAEIGITGPTQGANAGRDIPTS